MKKCYILAMAAVLCSTVILTPPVDPVQAVSVQAKAAANAEWIGSGTDAQNLVVYDAAKNGSFRMSGRTYTQGIVFAGSGNDTATNVVSSVTYDVSAFSSLHFTVGHIDNSMLNKGTLSIMKDGAETDNVLLSYNITARAYTLDVSDAETVTFTVTTAGKAQFGFGELYADGSTPEKPSAAPEYDSPEKLLNAGYNMQNTLIYTASDRSQSFKMSGRTYYQGLMFSGGPGYNETNASLFTVNTEKISRLRFTAGHVDNTPRQDATVKIYRDNIRNEAEDITLNCGMALKEIELDVADTKCLMIWVDRGRDSAFAFGDIEADGTPAEIRFTAPAAGTPEQLIGSVFDTENCQSYTETDKSSSFKMNGRTFYQGLTFSGGASYSQTNVSLVSLNVENYQTLTFTAGHIDNTTMKDASVTVYRDNIPSEEETIPLNSTMKLRRITLDVSETKVLRLAVERGGDSAFAFGDFSADGTECGLPSAVPSYASPEKLLDASFNPENISVCSTADQSKSFKMNGRTYYQGIMFNGGASYNSTNTSRIAFNTENVSRLSFTVGHLDNTALMNATLYIYRDNIKSEEETLSLSPAMNLKELELDVTDTDVLMLVTDRESSLVAGVPGYGFGNVAFDGREAEFDCKIPKYTDTAQFLKAGFNTQKATVYSGDDSSNTFTLGDETCQQGILFGGGNSYTPSTENRISFNVENVGAVSFRLGCVKSDGKGESVLRVLRDNQEIRQIPLKKDMHITEYTFNTAGCSVLTLVVSASYSDSYAAADIRLSEQPVIQRGDVNGDGAVSVDDALIVLKAYTERIAGNDMGLTAEQIQAADVDGTGVIGIEDAMYLLKYYTENTVAGKHVTWEELLD